MHQGRAAPSSSFYWRHEHLPGPDTKEYNSACVAEPNCNPEQPWLLLESSAIRLRWESVRRRKAFKPDGISSSSATSDDFVCTQVGPVFPPCSRKSLSSASFQADRREVERLAPRRRREAVLLASSHQQTEAQKAGPQIQERKGEKKGPFCLLEALGKIKVSAGANAAQS